MKHQCLIIAGEKSGEEHGLSFLKKLKEISPETHFFGVGGSEFKKLQVECLYDIADFSSWGYSGVFKKIPFYKQAMQKLLEEVDRRKCQTAILIDFQSFNLRLALKLKTRGVRVLYFVAPQAWAWKEYRVKSLASAVHTLFTIIPFEKNWFQIRGVQKIISVEHPQWTLYRQQILSWQKIAPKKIDLAESKTIKILLLPGSRDFEFLEMMPEFIDAIERLKNQYPEHLFKLSIVEADSLPESLFIPYRQHIDVVYPNEQLTEALKDADLCFAASGTVTLTCALFKVPTIVCYRGSLFNYFIYEQFVPYRGPMSLANIVLNDSVFPELPQDRVSGFNIAAHFKVWYNNPNLLRELRQKLQHIDRMVQGEECDISAYMKTVIENTDAFHE